MGKRGKKRVKESLVCAGWARAHAFVKENALMVTKNTGGSGAVREVCDFLLKSQNKYDDLMQSFLR